MNTPRSKTIKRHPGGPSQSPTTQIYGSFNFGIRHQKMAETMGKLITFWPSVEDKMIGFLRILLGGHSDIPARIVFRTVKNAEAKISLMQALLEQSELNRDKDESYDALIDEFKSLNGLRNKYAHSVFWTREPDLKVVIYESQIDDWYTFNKQRELRLPELTDCLKRMEALLNDIMAHVARFEFAKRKALPQAAVEEPRK